MNKHTYILLSLAVLFAIIYAYGNFLPQYWRAPDETANIFFSRLYASNYSLTYDEPLNAITFGGVGPRHSRTTGTTIYPAGFIGLPATYGMFLRLIPNSLFFINSLYGVLLVLFIYLITREIINDEYAFISALMLFFAAPLWYFSAVIYNNMAALSLFTAGAYYLLKALQEDKWQQYILLGIFWGGTILMRYEFIIFISIPLALTFITTPSLWKRTRKFAAAGIIILVFFTPVLLFNNKIFGNPLTVSYMANIGEHKQTLTERMTQKFKAYILPNQFFPERIRESASRYIFRFFIPFWILALPGIAIALHSYRKNLKKHKTFLIFAISFLLSPVVYFGSGRFYGYEAHIPFIHSSFVRYWLAWYMFAVLLCCFIPLKLKSSPLRTAFLALLVFINLTILFTPQEGLLVNYSSAYHFAKTPEMVANLTEENALIFGEYWGKWVFPTRKMTAYFGPENIYDPQNFTNVVCRLHKEGIPVYIVPSGALNKPESIQPYTNATCGLNITFISNVMSGLYKAEPIEGT
jgi:hypothetical protein